MKRMIAKKLYHLRRAFLPSIVKLTFRKLIVSLRMILHGRFAIPVFRHSSHNMTFLVLTPKGKQKLYEIDSDPSLFEEAYRPFENDILPRLLEVNGSWIRVDWIRGSLLSKEPDSLKAHVLAQLLAKIHSHSPEVQAPSFRHFDRLIGRCRTNIDYVRADSRALITEFTEGLTAEYSRLSENLSSTCTHPDLISSNVIRGGDTYVIVDNEFLYAGQGKEFDIINSMYSLSSSQQTHFLAEYGNLADLHMFEMHRDFWEKLYLLKRLSRYMRYRNNSMTEQQIDRIRTALSACGAPH